MNDSRTSDLLPSEAVVNAAPFDRPLLVGRGKIAKHLRFYFASQGVEVLRWENAREITPDFLKLMAQARSVWLLVSDAAIESVHDSILAIQANSPAKSEKPVPPFLHTSAATQVSGVAGFHPLMTFGPNPYDLETYEKIPFTSFGEASLSFLSSFAQAFPNPLQQIEKEHRAFYHAMAVMGSNFPQILWTSITKESEQKLKLPITAFDPILERAFINFINLREKSLTGPLVRGDVDTVKKNLHALEQTPFKPLYESFIQFYHSQNPEAKI
jgi:hypothetical protein